MAHPDELAESIISHCEITSGLTSRTELKASIAAVIVRERVQQQRLRKSLLAALQEVEAMELKPRGEWPPAGRARP